MSANAQSMRPETKGFVFHLLAYLAVNAVLIIINLSLDPSDIWFVWPLFGWGIGIGAHGLALFLHYHEDRGGIYSDHAVRGFIVHAYVYVGVNILLFILNMMTTPTKIWFIWPLLGWGVGVGVHGFLVMRAYNRRHAEAAKGGAVKAEAVAKPAVQSAETAAKPAAKAAPKRQAKAPAAKAAPAKRTTPKSTAKLSASKSRATKSGARKSAAKSGTTKRAPASRKTKPA